MSQVQGHKMTVSLSALFLVFLLVALDRIGLPATAAPDLMADSFLGILPDSDALSSDAVFSSSSLLDTEDSYFASFPESFDDSVESSGILPSFPFPIFQNNAALSSDNSEIENYTIAQFPDAMVPEPPYSQELNVLRPDSTLYENRDTDSSELPGHVEEAQMQFADDLTSEELDEILNREPLFRSGWTFSDRLPDRLRPAMTDSHDPVLAATYTDGNVASMIDAIAEDGDWDEGMLFGDVLEGAQAPTIEELEEDDPHAMPPPKVPQGVFTMCYAADEQEILTRCVKAKEHGTGVVIQMLNAALVEPINEPVILGEDVDPPAHKEPKLDYENFVDAMPKSWYDKIRQLKDESGLSVMGLWFGPPDYELMHNILKDNPELFDGVQVDWEGGKGACPNKLTGPPRKVDGEIPEWVWNTKFTLTYYSGGQDREVCILPSGSPYDWDVFVNKPDRGLPLPEGWTPVFPCYGGAEGRCYHAFTTETATACNPKRQRYAFAPFDRMSGSMLNLYDETCTGLGKKLPPHDLVMAI